MTKEQEHDINNALLTLMYEWKIGIIDQDQALKEFKACLKYYSRMEDVMRFEDNELVDIRRIDYYGEEKTVEHVKQALSERIIKEIVNKGCASFEEVEHFDHPASQILHKHFSMKIEAIIQQKQLSTNDTSRNSQ